MFQQIQIGEYSHFRVDPLTGWNAVLISPSRKSRPNSKPKIPVFAYPLNIPESDKECPFCPGNEKQTPKELGRVSVNGLWQARGTVNKYPCQQLEAGNGLEKKKHPRQLWPYLFTAEGSHELIIDSPFHNAVLSKTKGEDVAPCLVLLTWRYEESRGFNFSYFRSFKNYGDDAAASMVHPHWQIVVSNFCTPHLYQMLKRFEEFARENEGVCPLCLMMENRIIGETDNFRACVPLVPFDNYEVIIAPRRHISNFAYQLKKESLAIEFAELLSKVIRCVKRAIQEPVLPNEWEKHSDPPYNIWLNTAPYTAEAGFFHWNMQIRFLTSKDGGYEKGTGAKIITAYPEDVAELLKKM